MLWVFNVFPQDPLTHSPSFRNDSFSASRIDKIKRRGMVIKKI